MLKKVALIPEIKYSNLYMIKLIDTRIYIYSLLACLLFGCGGPSRNASGSYGPSQITALNNADKFMRMAGKGQTEAELNYLLQATENYIAANQTEEAEQLLNTRLKPKLSANNLAYKQILNAQLQLAKRDNSGAQQHLSGIWTPKRLPNELQIKFYRTRAECYRRSGSMLEAVQERIHLSKLLKSSEEQRQNTDQIWEILSQLTPETLRLLQRPNRDELNGWVTFANITKQYDLSQEQKIQALASWQSSFPNHPAQSFMPTMAPQPATVNTVATQNTAQAIISEPMADLSNISSSQPRKIALLLPLQGPHSPSAQAVRDGFLAAYYAQKNSSERTKIQIYDSTGKEGLQAVYKQIVDEGADFIVGPLIKEDVETLNNYASPSVPVLALNVSLNQKARTNIFQFGLAPETEAQAVAEKAWQDGHRNALIITPKSAWGKRMQDAFQDYWLTLGGKIIAVEQIQSQTNLNKEIRRLLAIDASEERAAELKRLGLKFTFDPRRRQDPDMVFIATNPALARQVKPLLNFYYAARLPAYASSSIFNGKAQPGLDQDLNGIKFCDMPWILDDAVKAKSTYRTVAQAWPGQFDQYARLYALGVDAYKISTQVNQLNMLPNVGISGMTGMLTIDSQHKVQRRLMWASFKKGLPQIDGENY